MTYSSQPRLRPRHQPRSILQFAIDLILLSLVIHELAVGQASSVETVDDRAAATPTYIELLRDLYLKP